MKLYYIGKITNNKLEFFVNASNKNFISQSILDSMIDSIKYSQGYSGGKCETVGKDKIHSIAASRSNGNGLIIITDTDVYEDEMEILLQDFFRYDRPLSQLNNEIDLDDFKFSTFHEIANLPKEIDHSCLSILSPLRLKLKQEKNNEKRIAAKELIDTIEDALLDRLKNNIDTEDFMQIINAQIAKAEPILEQQTGWKKIIDDCVNALHRLFSNQESYSEGKRFTLFSSPNNFKAEIEDAKIQFKNHQFN